MIQKLNRGEKANKEERAEAGFANIHVTESNHADGLPYSETDSRRHAAIKAHDTILGVDVLECLADGKVLGTVWIFRLALHLDPNDFDGLIPRTETTSQAASQNLLERSQFLSILFAGHFSNRRLRKSRQSKPRTPIGRLADGYRVDALVDAANSFPAIDVHKGLKSAGRFDTRGGQLVLSNLDRFHASAESHGGVSLRNTTDHPSADSAHKIRRAHVLCIVFRLRGHKEQDRPFCRSFNPGPGNQALIVWYSICQSVCLFHWEHLSNRQPSTPPRPHILFMAPAKLSLRLAAMVVLTTSNG